MLDGKRVAVKKPILSTSEDLDRFHKELQLLWSHFSPTFSVCVWILFTSMYATLKQVARELGIYPSSFDLVNDEDGV